MRNHLRTTLALAVLATLAPAQHTDTATDGTLALARAKSLEDHEGNLRAAEAGYRALLAADEPAPIHAEAALRLGSLLWRLDRRPDATPILLRAVAAGGTIGEDAQRILQGEGAADKLAQERLARARALVSRLFSLLRTKGASSLPEQEALDKSLTSARQELAFLGDAAAQALVEMLRELRKAADQGGGNVEKDLAVLDLADQLWRIGTAPARDFLLEVAADPMVSWRRAIVARCKDATEDMLPAAVPFLRDGDATGDVQRSAAVLAPNFSVDLLVQLVADTAPDCRAAGWAGLARRWYNIPPAEREPLVARIGSHLVAAVTGDDLRVREAADNLRWNLAMQGPSAGRVIVLELLAKTPHKYMVSEDAAEAFELGDDAMRTLVAAGKTLGTCPHFQPGANNGGSPLLLTSILAAGEPRWSVASIDGLLDLLDLGYGRATEVRWLDRFLSLASPAQTARLIAVLPRIHGVRHALDALIKKDVPQQAFPALRATMEQAIAGTTDGWAAIGHGRENGKEVERASSEAVMLLQLAGRTGAAEAPAWLGDLAQLHPSLADAAANALVESSVRHDDEGTRAQMRTLLVWPRTQDGGLAPTLRELLFAELVRRGDVPTIPLLPRAFELGLAWSNHPVAAVGKFSGMQRLGVVDGDTWHGYGAARLAEAWQTMLASTPRIVANELVTSRNEVPLVAMPAFVRALPTLAKTFADNDPERHVSHLVKQLEHAGAADVAAGSDLRSALVDLLRDGDPQIVVLVLQRLNAPVLRELAAEARTAIQRVGSTGNLVASLHRAGVAVTTEEWRAGLQSAEWNRCLNAMPASVDGTLRREVEAMLTSSNSDRRTAACSALARWLSSDSVGPLLEALRDPSAEVRNAAKEALERIRFQQEQQSFWAGAKDGIDTSPAATAAKLLAQARPGEPKEQRLLAIRSLAALGSNEALPHLIDWTKDADAEVAAAARAALAAIHGKASQPK